MQRPVVPFIVAMLAFASCSRLAVPEMRSIPGGLVGLMALSGMVTHAEPQDAQGLYEVEPFLISVREVTVGEFRQFVQDTGYETYAEASGGAWTMTPRGWVQSPENNWSHTYFPQTEDSPVNMISFVDALSYCNWLSRKAGLEEAYKFSYDDKDLRLEIEPDAKGYRLPTEAEWALARYGDGARTSSLADPELVAEGAGIDATAPAAPSPYGIENMQTSAWEWLQDTVMENTAPSVRRALRGGAYVDYTELRHFTSYFFLNPLGRDFYMGIRLARSAD